MQFWKIPSGLNATFDLGLMSIPTAPSIDGHEFNLGYKADQA